MRAPVSILVPCFNNEDVIGHRLQELRWGDELVVCDSFSSDATVEIASGIADRVLQHEYVNSANQKNWALPQLRHDWVFVVDTDEVVSIQLRREVEAALSLPNNSVGFRIPRANIIFGRRMRHGLEWPDYQIRLFKKDSGRYVDRWVHASVTLDGPSGTLTSPLLHYPHQNLDSVRRTLLGRYTEWEARQRNEDGVRFSWAAAFARPLAAFFRRYVLLAGYRDGWQGAFIAVTWSVYVWLSYLKLRRLQRFSQP